MKSPHQHCQSHELLGTAREISVQEKRNRATNPAWIAFNAKNEVLHQLRSLTRLIQN